MPIRNGAPVGAPTWIDLASSDVERRPGPSNSRSTIPVSMLTMSTLGEQFYGNVLRLDVRVQRLPEYGVAEDHGTPSSRTGPPGAVAGLMHDDPQWNGPTALRPLTIQTAESRQP